MKLAVIKKVCAEAKEFAASRFPEADEIKAGWYDGDPIVEVWKNGRATLYAYSGWLI